MSRTLKGSLRAGGHIIALERRERRWREPPLGRAVRHFGIMSNYSRMFLHFLHALINDRERVQVFLFGTRLTNVTRELARSDVDEAMEKVAGVGEGLVGRHAHRRGTAGIQLSMGAPGPDAGRPCPAHDRWSRSRRH